MPIEFTPARRENVWLRMLLMAVSGAGKSLGALSVASTLFDGTLPIYAIDSEHGRMKLYADRFSFNHFELVEDFSPEAYIAAIDAAEKVGTGGILIIDSITHEWAGKGGVLQLADKFGDWKVVRPRHATFIERLLACNMHVICCCRSKMKYEVSEYDDNGRTRQRITKLGLGPVQDDASIYEFDVVGDIDIDTHLTTFSNRCDPLVDTTRSLVPGHEVSEILTAWLSEGEPPVAPEAAGDAEVKELVQSLLAEGFSQDKIDGTFMVARREARGVLTPAYVADQYAKSQKRLERKAVAAAKKAEDAAETPSAAPPAPADAPAPAAPAAAEDAAPAPEETVEAPAAVEKPSDAALVGTSVKDAGPASEEVGEAFKG